MTTLVFDRIKIDTNWIQFLLYSAALFLISMASPLLASPNAPESKPSLEPLLISDLKTCLVPYTNEYCRFNEENQDAF